MSRPIEGPEAGGGARRQLKIAVDGPASSGKGTVARLVARQLDYLWIDTGALYRAVALTARRRGVAWSSSEEVASLAEGLRVEWVRERGEEPKLLVNGEDLSLAVRAEEIGAGASIVAAIPRVRSALLGVQRHLAARGGVVMDGRDIGTVVLPDAELKVYLDASLDERARRRWLQFPSRNYDAVRLDIAERDDRDRTRVVAPLCAAADALRLDTTDLPIEEAVTIIVGWARERGSGSVGTSGEG